MIDSINSGNSIGIDHNRPSTIGSADQSTQESGFDSMLNANSETASEKLEEILPALLEIIQKLVEMLAASANSASESSSEEGSGGGESGAAPATGGSVPEGSNSVVSNDSPESSSSEKIPPITEHKETFSLGGKEVNIGGDGTASAAEVKSTGDSIKHLYENSDTFKSMIDDSSDPKFDVSVGKREDNLSWGSSKGAVFMNLNNIEASNSDRFQELLGHEFGHASIDLKHGAEMERTAAAVAAEA